MTQARVGWRAYVSPTGGGTGTDTDAQAFITAAAITDSVQVSALNTLVTDLKTYGLWTKMKALYPFVGGSAASHKFNLKDSRDLDAAYRLVFNGGWIHSSNGALPNGTTGYADTKLVPSSVLSLNSTHVSYYSRTNNMLDGIDFGVSNAAFTNQLYSYIKAVDGKTYFRINRGGTTESNIAIADSRLFYMINRNSPIQEVLFTNTTKNIFNYNSTGLSNYSIFLGSTNLAGTPNYYGNKESAFVSIGDGLTDTEAANFYTSVQKFQTTLGRHVGTPYVSDADAISFLMVAGITDSTQAAAINTLVIRMKADGVWTKMKAIYPFVGGTAFSHKWNLKDPRDLDAAFRLGFYGGVTHGSNGVLFGGVNGYADSKLSPYIQLTANNNHLSVYSNLNLTGTDVLGEYSLVAGALNSAYTQRFDLAISSKDAFATPNTTFTTNANASTQISYVDSSKIGNYLSTRTSNINFKLFKNSSLIGSNTITNTAQLPDYSTYIGGWNQAGSARFSYRRLAFATIGDGLSDTEASNFYTAVQAYQTTLGRQVNVPLVSDADAQLFLNAANITSFQQASAVNKLVTDLKSAGIWTKMKAIYPFVGGSAASHKFNLKDPRDLDEAFRLGFYGGWTHTSTGALPNGTTGFADTNLTPSSRLSSTAGFGYYSRTNNITGIQADMGAQYYFPIQVFDCTASGNTRYFGANSNTTSSFTDADTRGFYQIYRPDSTTVKALKNTTSYSATISPATPNLDVFIGARNENGVAQLFSLKEFAFAYIQENFTDSDANALYTIVQTYQTSLGRQVDTPVYNNGLVLNLDAGNANSYPGTGTTWFDLASGNNGTLVNGPTYDATNGGSLLFDGINDNVDLGTGLNSTSLTISLWLNFNSTSNQAILNKGNFNNNQASYTISYYNNKIRFDTYASDAVYGTLSSNFIPVLNTWYNIVYVSNSNSSTYSIYINGINRTTDLLDWVSTYVVPRTGSYLVKLGSNSDGSLPFRGKISKVLIYQNVLSATEVLNNFNSTRGRFGL